MLKTTLAFTAFATLALTGCQTVTALKSGSAGGMTNLASCPQIYSSFEAYDQDQLSIESLGQTVGISSADLQGITPENVSRYYATIRDTANLALGVQGCEPLK
jgi:hypothetical protein